MHVKSSSEPYLSDMTSCSKFYSTVEVLAAVLKSYDDDLL